MIFEDNTGKRWFKIKALFLIGLMLLLASLSTYVLNLYRIIDFPIINVINMHLFNVMKKLFISYLFITIIIGFLRMLIIFYFCFRQLRRQKIIREHHSVTKNFFKLYRPSVTVIIPVFNEEVVINRTIKGILKTRYYPLVEILVIDDGSTDQTVKIIEKEFANNRRVKLIKKNNGGKSSALNLGIQCAQGDIIITIDADTIIEKSTIAHLVSNFSDPRVAAVSGNCKVGNIKNQLTLWQHIEFVTSNNLDKRAFEELSCITVVPGSNSAWRKSVIEKIGYFHHDTLAEDTELTFRVLNAGHKIVYEDRALSYEESPETLKDFIKQRIRWSYGILQAAWKHKKNIITSSNKTLKYFAVPSLLFSYLLFLTSPLVDIIFIVSVLSGTTSIYLFALLFYLTDFLNSFIAFKVGKEKMKPLIWLFIQRIGYRYLLAYVTWKALISALRGESIGWNKLNRSGNNEYKS
ncbi:glycosyltransferase [Solibacillus sp. FSL H8-0538]|uniref:glycosyltransferase n=1 Tax=Solibacillus sp. FSL H8-0538 TaxID=2921400 RepID=UPI0030FB7D74